MTFLKSGGVLSLMSMAAALVLFLPMNGTAQTLKSADSSATQGRTDASASEAPQVIPFTDGRDDLSFHMTTDAAGNFYIAALLEDGVHSNSFAAIKFSTDGKLLKVLRLANSGIAVTVAVDAGGNLYVGGNSPKGGVLVSYTASGKRRWSKVIGDTVDAVVLDSSGDVYAGGTMNLTSMYVAKFTTNGGLVWQTSHVGATPQPCGSEGLVPGTCFSDMHLDSSGNVIAFGYSTNAGPNTDNTTLKVSPQGELLWVENFTQQTQFNKVPAAGAVDHENGIYVTGQGVDPFTGQRFPYTVKYDTNGNQIFAVTGVGNGGSSIAVDPSGDILLSGFAIVEGQPDETVTKMDPSNSSGTPIFVTQVPTGGKVVSDAEGNIFVSGADGSNDYVVTKLNSAGELQWTFKFATEILGAVSDSIVDPFGNLLVTGYGMPAGDNEEILTLKFPEGFQP